MERDYFAEEIESNPQPEVDYYSEEVEKNIPKSDSFIDRAFKASGAYDLAEGKPFDAFRKAISPTTGYEFFSGEKDRLIDKGLESAPMKSPFGSALKTAAPGLQLGGLGLKMASDPLTWMAGPTAARGVASGVGKVTKPVSKAVSRTKEAFGAPRKIKELEGISSRVSTGEEMLKESSRRESLFAKPRVRGTIKAASDVYEEGLGVAEQQLSKRGVKNLDYYKEVVEPVIEEASLKGFTNSKSYKALSKVKGELSSNSSIVSAERIKNLKNEVRTGNDYISKLFESNHRKFLTKNSPEMTSMNSEFAPYARSRSFVKKAFNPDAPESIEKGAKLLEKAAKGEASVDEIALLKNFQEGSGRFAGSGELGAESKQIGETVIGMLRRLDKNINSFKSGKGALLTKKAELNKLLKLRNDIIKYGTTAGAITVGAGALGRATYSVGRGVGQFATD